jgi:transposase
MGVVMAISVAMMIQTSRRLETPTSHAHHSLVYVDKVLVPTLRSGDIVVLDNLGSHKSKAVRQAIRATGAKLLFLPKYSPDLNPIEQLFAKIKHGLRKAAKRTFETVSEAIAEVLDTVSPNECSNYLVNAGYVQT